MSESETEYLIVTQYFHPDTASTGQLITDLAVGLEQRGLNMSVLTTQPNYHSGDHDKEPRKTTHEGVAIRRIRAPQVRQSSLVRRAFNWIVYSVWMSIALLISRTDGDREVIFTSNPPFFPLAMWAVCRLRGWKYTYIVHDFWPLKGVAFGFWSESGIVDTVWSWLHDYAFADASNVVTIGEVMRETVIDRTNAGLSEEDVSVIHNWADEDFIEPLAKADNQFSETHGLLDRFTLLYSGNIGLFHDLETVTRAMPAVDDDVVFQVIGEGDNKERIVEIAEKLGVRGDKVRFLPYQPLEDLPYTLTSGDVSIVTVKEEFKGICVSSKLYTSLAAGMPILAVVADGSDEAKIVNEHDAGVQVTQGETEAVAEAVEHWIADPDLVERQGWNARQAFETRFTKSESVDAYYRLLVE